MVLFTFGEERARVTELSLQARCGLGQLCQLASDWVALGLIQTMLNIVPRHDLWGSCP